MITNSALLEALQRDAEANYKEQQQRGAKLVAKWKKTGLLDGFKTKTERYTMSTLLENQARQLLKEITKSGATGSEEWSGIALPLVRKIFGELPSKEFVSLQSLQAPGGLVFFLDFKYGTSQPGFTTSGGSTGQDNSVYGVLNQAGAPTGGLYGAGRFAYSTKAYEATGLAFVTGSVDWVDVDFNPALSGSLGQLSKVTVDLNNLNHDTLGVRSFTISGSGVHAIYPAYTKAVNSSGATSSRYVTFVVSGSAVNESAGICSYSKQPTAGTRGDFEATDDPAYTDNTNNNIVIPEINMDIKQEPIVAKTKKLKAVWTSETSQDMMAYQSLDAETELSGVISEYITMEIDLEILDMLIGAAVTSEVWSAKVGESYLGGSTFGPQDGLGTTLFYDQLRWFQTLGVKLNKVSNSIHRKTLRGGANFIVLSPDLSTIVETMPGFATDATNNQMQYAMGVQKVGSFNNKWKIFKNPYMTENTILMGFRGTQFLETGAVLASYIPLIMTPPIFDPVNLTPRKGIMTRYGKKVLRSEFFGKVVVAGTNYI